jgi:ABC-type transport system involved in multi-copper enzyme maturation permease subunit
MGRLFSAEWLRIRSYWLPWALLAVVIAVVVAQVGARVNRLRQLEATWAEPPVAGELTPGERLALEADRLELGVLRDDLRYPALIGAAARRATDGGWFLLIVLAAVMGGEDFSRRTLPSMLTRGVGRGRYLAARCLALWMVAGLAVLVVALLAAIAGPVVHALVTDGPLTVEGLGEALLVVVRVWLACLPFVTATLFWAVLGRQTGPALGVGIALHGWGYLNGFVIPILALAAAGAGSGALPSVWRWQVRLFSVTLSYNADVFVNWGSPFQRGSIIRAMGSASTIPLGADTLLPTTPWRAAAFLAGYAALFLGLAVWILRRRDVRLSK